MVQVKDEGVFDAPIDKLWRYVQDDSHQHPSFTVTNAEQKGNVMIMEADVKNPDGKTTHKETWKFTFSPPKGWDMEYLAGPMKSSKHTHTYTPMADKTRVDVIGDFRIEGLDDGSTRKAVLAYFEQAFNEDNAALQNYK